MRIKQSYIFNIAKCQFLLLFLMSNASATYQLIIANRQYPNGGVSAILDPIADSLQTKFNNTLASSDNAGFLTQVGNANAGATRSCLLYTSPNPRDRQKSRMPSSA